MGKTLVKFTATKRVSEPVTVKFNTKDGPKTFKATEKVSEPVTVKFYAKEKK